ncbi:MAG: AAA family ATPase [Armatimonadota bacterium]
MSSSSEAVRKMLLAHVSGDEAAFQDAAREYIEEERRKRHSVLARDLESILADGGSKSRHDSLTALGTSNGSLPKDKDRGLVLVEVREPRRELESLVLAPSLRSVLDRVIEEGRRADVLRTYGLRPISKILFCGPPGCGKTVAAEAVANALYLPLVLVRFDAVISSYLGETAANLRKVFDFARSRPMVLFFDEFDAVGKERAAEEEHGELKRVVTSLLQMMDSFRGDALTIAASNHQGLLDSALWRRFDEILYFDRPDPKEIEELLTRNLRQIGLSPKIKLATVARSLTGMTHADVERVALDATKQTILSGGNRVEAEVLAQAVARQQERRKVTDGEPSVGPASRRSTRRSAKEAGES